MENIQIILTIILLVIEVVAFAWLIIDIQKSKKNQVKIIELEYQILKVENSIMELERTIVKKIDNLQIFLREFCIYHKIKGTIILGEEGINGTVAGLKDPIMFLEKKLKELRK